MQCIIEHRTTTQQSGTFAPGCVLSLHPQFACKVPGSESSRVRKFQRANGLGSEKSSSQPGLLTITDPQNWVLALTDARASLTSAVCINICIVHFTRSNIRTSTNQTWHLLCYHQQLHISNHHITVCINKLVLISN